MADLETGQDFLLLRKYFAQFLLCAPPLCQRRSGPLYEMIHDGLFARGDDFGSGGLVIRFRGERAF